MKLTAARISRAADSNFVQYLRIKLKINLYNTNKYRSVIKYLLTNQPTNQPTNN